MTKSRILSSGILIALLTCIGCGPGIAGADTTTKWPANPSPAELGRRVASYTLENHMPSINYQNVCCAYGVLMFAKATQDYGLRDRVEQAYAEYLTGAKQDERNFHQGRGVVAQWFGFVPLELFDQTGNRDYFVLGQKYADEQFQNVREDGLPGYTRLWVDDMYGIGTLQGLAYKHTGDSKYAEQGIRGLMVHAQRLQQPNGLFHHTAGSARFFWCRGNGWAAAGMTEMLLALPKDHPGRKELMQVYRNQMKGLIEYQHQSGAWRQLIDYPESWAETSGTAMFVFAMATGVAQGWLPDKPYRNAAQRGWLALASHVDQRGRLREVCVGTGGRDAAEKYLARPRVPGDAHGQGALLWAASAITQMSGPHRTTKPANDAKSRQLRSEWIKLAGKTQWKPYPNNPIIEPGRPGQWDCWAVMSMTVVKVGNTFHLYYEGGLTGCGDLQIGHATSTDALHWTKDPANPVLRPGKKGDWDEGATWDPFVIYEDGLFKMWYGGERIGHRDFQCGYAVSKDGTHFTKKGKISTFDVGDIGDMHVYHDTKTGRYYMYYWDRGLKKADRLRVAVSKNETDFDFENAQTISIRNEVPGHRYTHVFKVDETWYMFYGYENKPKTGFAISTDGLTWKAANNNLLPSEDAEILPIQDDLYLMFYCPMGLQDEKNCDIRLAILNNTLTHLATQD